MLHVQIYAHVSKRLTSLNKGTFGKSQKDAKEALHTSHSKECLCCQYKSTAKKHDAAMGGMQSFPKSKAISVHNLQLFQLLQIQLVL